MNLEYMSLITTCVKFNALVTGTHFLDITEIRQIPCSSEIPSKLKLKLLLTFVVLHI